MTARTVNGCVPFVVGIHTCDVEIAKTQLLQAKEAGAAAVLVKYKGNPNASACQVLAFYQELSDLGVLPILYYHYPTDTDLKLSPAEIAAIVKLPNVIGAKISTLDLREFEAIARHTCGCDKVYLSGTALNLTQFLEAGGNGAMCPEAVLLPAKSECVFRLWCDGRHDSAREAQKELFVLSPVLRGGHTTEKTARKKVMFTQDHDIRLRMQDYAVAGPAQGDAQRPVRADVEQGELPAAGADEARRASGRTSLRPDSRTVLTLIWRASSRKADVTRRISASLPRRPYGRRSPGISSPHMVPRLLILAAGKVVGFPSRVKLWTFNAACRRPRKVQESLLSRILAEQSETGSAAITASGKSAPLPTFAGKCPSPHTSISSRTWPASATARSTHC